MNTYFLIVVNFIDNFTIRAWSWVTFFSNNITNCSQTSTSLPFAVHCCNFFAICDAIGTAKFLSKAKGVIRLLFLVYNICLMQCAIAL